MRKIKLRRCCVGITTDTEADNREKRRKAAEFLAKWLMDNGYITFTSDDSHFGYQIVTATIYAAKGEMK